MTSAITLLKVAGSMEILAQSLAKVVVYMTTTHEGVEFVHVVAELRLYRGRHAAEAENEGGVVMSCGQGVESLWTRAS